MVYCGKPSKGCQTCRERKIRCDQVPEGCGQCAKQKLVCPGYREQLDLIFRNESQSVVRKVKARAAKKAGGHNGNGGRSGSAVDSGNHSRSELIPSGAQDISKSPAPLVESQQYPKPESIPPDHSQLLFPPVADLEANQLIACSSLSRWTSNFKIQPALTPTLAERATNYFVTNYLIGVKGPTRGHLDVLDSMLHFDDNLTASIRAVGLASFANIENAPAVMSEARREYSVALKLTNRSLQSSNEARKDSTLLSVIILSIYETVTGSNQRSLNSWAEHIRGAAALVKLRGPQQLLTPNGRRMVIQVTSNLLLACIQRELALPDHILDLRRDIKKFIDPDDPAWQVQELMIHFCTFRATICDRSTGEHSPSWILERALALDGKFRSVFWNPPLSWRYETRHTHKDCENVWKGSYHVYYDYWIAQLWNAMRTCRMMLNENIRDVLLRGFMTSPPLFSASKYTAQLQLSTDVIFQLQSDVLASVPQHIGFAPQKPFSGQVASLTRESVITFDNPQAEFSPLFQAVDEEGSKLPSYPDDNFPVLRASGGYFLMWPLFLSGVIDVASDESRIWVAARLRYIARTMGIRQASVLAVIVENRYPVKVWTKEDRENLSSVSGDDALDIAYVEDH